MAINSKNFVDISTTFPKAGATNRAFGGMVFTPNGLSGISVDANGLPTPKDENGEPYPKEAETYVIKVGNESYPFVWDEEKGYVATDGDSNYYPANAFEISIWIAYEKGNPIGLSLDDALTYFGMNSKEYEFAAGYYSFTSPTGRFPSKLKFKKQDANKTLLENFTDLDKATNQFGAFTFLAPDDSSSSTANVDDDYLAQLLKVAVYNHSLDTKYLFVVNQKAQSGATDYLSAITNCGKFSKVSGTCFVYGATDVSAYMPMAILASTDYANGQVVNFMFKQFANEEPTVQDQNVYSAFNQGLVNFYGQTQTNGQTLDFFQRGFNTNGTDTASYCNEMWFKAECETALLNLLISNERIPADQNGVASVKIAVADVCSVASRNGSFMQKEASQADRKTVREIVNLSGGEELEVDGIIVDVGTKGYSIYAYLSEMADADKLGKTSEKIIVYYVFYGTADSIRFIKGNDILLK